jgi:UDP-3-O-[3-hydroxymyristoyl] glucosamine N-acyltransferase
VCGLGVDARLGEGVSVGPLVVIQPGAVIGDRTVLVAGCYVGHEAVIGSDCRLHAHVSVRERCVLGARVIIHDGAVIGSDGFGYTPDKHGVWQKVMQLGIVEIGDDVEIGANTTIDRARFGKTRIGNGVKIDNLVQVAHNVQLGAHTAIAAQSGIAGSSQIGEYVQIGGQVGIIGHIRVADKVRIQAQSGVLGHVTEEGKEIGGAPAYGYREFLKAFAYFKQLPDLEKRLRALERQAAQPGETT